MKYKYIFWDFNGTILDDVELCLNLLNDMLKKRNLPIVSKDKYLHIFGFPVIEYYKRAGLTFENESFESMAVDFIDKYQPASYACSLYSGIKELLAFNKEKGIIQILLSASEINNLLDQVKHFEIDSYFDACLGLDNIHATSKIEIGQDYIENNQIDRSYAVMIGDTLHDKEVADALGIDCILVSNGHQAYDVLNVVDNTVVRNIEELKELIGGCCNDGK